MNIQIFVICALKSKTTQKSCNRQLERTSNLTSVWKLENWKWNILKKQMLRKNGDNLTKNNDKNNETENYKMKKQM